MNIFIKLLAALAITASVFLTGTVIGLQKGVTPTLGASSFTPVGGQTYTLSGAGVTATQTTIPLTSFTTPDGRAITMAMVGSIGYGTLEPNTSSKIEDITFSGITQNVNGTATLTGVTRGNDFVTPYAATPSLTKAHAGGSYFILSNTAGFYGQQFLFANNVGSSTATITYSNTAPPFYYPGPGAQSTGSPIATTSEFASIAYVNQVVASGAANATAAVKGIIQLATAVQAAAGTSLGSTGASLVPPNSLYNATQSATTIIPVTNTSGKLSQAFLDLTQAFTVSGQWTFNTLPPIFSVGLISQASSTMSTTTVTNALIANKPTQQYTSATTTTSFPLPFVIATSTGKASTAASNFASSTFSFVGFSQSVATNNQTVNIQTGGIVSGFTGLTTGSSYYLQDNGTIGTSAGTFSLLVGYAVSSTQLFINPKTLAPNIVTNSSALNTGPAGAVTGLSVTCTPPQIPTAGGWSGIPSGTQGSSNIYTVTQSQPSLTGWTFGVTCNTNGCNSGTVTVYAICVNP